MAIVRVSSPCTGDGLKQRIAAGDPAPIEAVRELGAVLQDNARRLRSKLYAPRQTRQGPIKTTIELARVLLADPRFRSMGAAHRVVLLTG